MARVQKRDFEESADSAPKDAPVWDFRSSCGSDRSGEQVLRFGRDFDRPLADLIPPNIWERFVGISPHIGPASRDPHILGEPIPPIFLKIASS